MNPLDAVCDRPRTDAICVNQLKNAKVVDKGLLQERPDVKIFLPFKFLFYRPDELFQPHQYNRYLGKNVIYKITVIFKILISFILIFIYLSTIINYSF